MAESIRRVGPDIGRLAQPARVGRYFERTFQGIDPQQVDSILRQADRGIMLDYWADLCEWVCDDERVSSVLDTRVDAVAAAPFDVNPGDDTPEGELAAYMCRDMLESTTGLESSFEDILNLYPIGYSLLEHRWGRRGGLWVSNPITIRPRDIQFRTDWTMQARTYKDDSGSYEWIDTVDHPNKFIVGVFRRRGSTPLRSGVIRQVAFLWLFKRWAYKFWVSGAERLGTPLMIGKVERDAHATARDTLRDGLENLSEGQAAILEANTGIEFPDTKFATSADVWKQLIEKCDDGITLAILGSLDSVDSGGGSYARAETQAEQTIEPRKQKLAKMLYGIVERDWLRPFLYFNLDKFGGVMPPMPQLALRIDKSLSETMVPQLIAASAITKNELRSAANLEPIAGGDALAQDAQSTPGGEYAASPLASQEESQSSYPTSNESALTSKMTESTPMSSALRTSGKGRGLASLLEDLPSLQPKPPLKPPSRSRASGKTSKTVSKVRKVQPK